MTRKLTDKEKRHNLLFRMIDGRAMAGLNRDLKKAKLERDPREDGENNRLNQILSFLSRIIITCPY